MKTTYIFARYICIALVLQACSAETNDKAENAPVHAADKVILTPAQFKTAGVVLGEISKRTISGTIPASGMMDVPPQSKVSVSAAMGGFVKSMSLLQGSRVEKGQVVVVMQHPDYIQMQQDYLEKNSRLTYLEAEYKRQEELSKENVNAQKTVQEAKAAYFSAKAVTEGLKAKLAMLNINPAALEKNGIQPTISLYSPISGYVTKVNTNIGAFVNPTDVLVEIVNTEHLHAELTIFEKDVPLLKINQRVLFTLANETTQRVARVHLIGREIGPDRSVQVHCHIDKQDRELIPGMYLKALVETDSAHVTAVPEDAVVHFGGKAFLFVAEANPEKHIFKMTEITTGNSEAGFVEVKLPDGFDMRSKIVIKSAFSLLAKMKNIEEE